MAQHDYVIDNASGATVRADINSALSAIQSLNSGTSEPSSTAAGMLWLDTTGGAPYALKVRDAGNNHWLTIGSVTDPGADGNLELLPGKINLPSTGGIYESDGSTEILTESSGAVTLKNTTIDSSVVFPSGSSVSGQISGGHILQVQTTILTASISDNNTNAFNDLTGLLVKITPSSSSSKILLNYNFAVGQSSGNNPKMFRVKRTISAVDNTSFAVGDSDGNREQATSVSYDASADVNGQNQHSFSFVDQPSTENEITYQLQLKHNMSPFTGNTVYIGKGGNNQVYNFSSPIVFIAMEIK